MAVYIILMKKVNEQWRVCVNFMDLSKVCSKDYFSLLKINQLVNAMASYQLSSNIDAYLGYN